MTPLWEYVNGNTLKGFSIEEELCREKNIYRMSRSDDVFTR